MKTLLTTAVFLVTAGLASAQASYQIPPPMPPVRIGLTVGGQGLGLDVTNKTVTVPADWTVIRQAAPVAAPPVRAVVGHPDRPDPFAPNGFWIVPGSAAPTSYAAPAVAAPVPFVGAGTSVVTRRTSVPAVVGVSTSSTTTTVTAPTLIAAPPAGRAGPIRRLVGGGLFGSNCGPGG